MTRDERLDERETVVRWDGHKDLVRIFTASQVVDRKIRKAGHAPYRESTQKGAWSGSFYSLPYKALRWGVRLVAPRQTGPRPHGFGAKRGSA